MTAAERWKAYDLVKPIAEKFEAEGRVEGQRLMLLRLLRLKFGELPEALKAQIGTATEAELLSRWAKALLTAASLDAVLSGDD